MLDTSVVEKDCTDALNTLLPVFRPKVSRLNESSGLSNYHDLWRLDMLVDSTVAKLFLRTRYHFTFCVFLAHAGLVALASGSAKVVLHSATDSSLVCELLANCTV